MESSQEGGVFLRPERNQLQRRAGNDANRTRRRWHRRDRMPAQRRFSDPLGVDSSAVLLDAHSPGIAPADAVQQVRQPAWGDDCESAVLGEVHSHGRRRLGPGSDPVSGACQRWNSKPKQRGYHRWTAAWFRRPSARLAVAIPACLRRPGHARGADHGVRKRDVDVFTRLGWKVQWSWSQTRSRSAPAPTLQSGAPQERAACSTAMNHSEALTSRSRRAAWGWSAWRPIVWVR